MSLLNAAVLGLSLSFAAVGVAGDTSRPQWFDQGVLTRQAQQLVGVLDAAPDFGLDSADYRLAFTPEELQALQALLDARKHH